MMSRQLYRFDRDINWGEHAYFMQWIAWRENCLFFKVSACLYSKSRFDVEEIFSPFLSFILKELYTSEKTLAQKIVLTPLNNEFVLKIRYSTHHAKKSANIFGQNFKSDLWSGPSVMVYNYKNILNLKINIVIYIHQIN